MKNIAKNGLLMAFVALMSAQANAAVVSESLTLRQTLDADNQVLIKLWSHSVSSDRLLGLNMRPGDWGGRNSSIQIFYRDSIENLEREQNPIKDLNAPRDKNIHEVTLSSDPSVIKKLILRVAYELHLGYQEAKAALSDPEGNIDLKRISGLLRMIKNTKSDLIRDQLEKDVRRSGEGKIAAINAIIEQYGDLYGAIGNAVAAVQLDSKRFLFQLPDRTIDHSHDFRDLISDALMIPPDMDPYDKNITGGVEVDRNMSKELKERDYIYVTLDDESASREVPSDWYSEELGGHLIVGGPAVAPKSTNISNGTNNTISSGKNNNTKEEMEQEIKEEKNKG